MLFWALVALAITAQSRKAKTAITYPAQTLATTAIIPMIGVEPPLTTAIPLVAVHRATTVLTQQVKTPATLTAQIVVRIVTRQQVSRTLRESIITRF